MEMDFKLSSCKLRIEHARDICPLYLHCGLSGLIYYLVTFVLGVDPIVVTIICTCMINDLILISSPSTNDLG